MGKNVGGCDRIFKELRGERSKNKQCRHALISQGWYIKQGRGPLVVQVISAPNNPYYGMNIA